MSAHGSSGGAGHGGGGGAAHGGGGKGKKGGGGFSKAVLDKVKEIVTFIVGGFSTAMPGVDFTVFISALNPISDDTAEAVAQKARDLVAKHKWLASSWVAMIAGMITAAVDKFGEQQSDEASKAAFKMAAKWLDAYAAEIRKLAKESHGEEATIDPLLRESLARGRAELINESVRLINRTTTVQGAMVDFEALGELLAKKAETLRVFEENLLHGPKKPKEPEVPTTPILKQITGSRAYKWAAEQQEVLEEEHAKINVKLSSVMDDIKTKTEMEAIRNRLRRASQKKSWIDKVSAFFLRIAGAIFFPRR